MVVNEKLFEVKDISFSYGGEEIFNGISFSIDKGDVLCILGPNGTGKTTLIKCLNGLHDIESGDILINGKNIKKLSFKEISRHIGDIPQSQRNRIMKGFREGKFEILVATDVAARGIDVDDVEAVFNYDIPDEN